MVKAVMQKGELMSDLISRQAAIDAIWKPIIKPNEMIFDALKQAQQNEIETLPSVEPERKLEKCSDCISRQAATERFDLVQSDDKCMGYDDIMAFLSSLPPVEPEIEKCDDCISRKDMLKKINNLCNNTCEYSKIQRKSMCDACKLDLVFDMINNAKPVEPERKTGKVVFKHRHHHNVNHYTGEDTDGETHTISVLEDYEVDEPYCSECGRRIDDIQGRFCAYCGVNMEVDG